MGKILKNVSITDDEFVRSFIETCEKTGEYDNVGKRADMAIAYLDSCYDFGLPFSHIEALIEFVANGTELKNRDNEERVHMTREEKVRQAVQILDKGCRKYINDENYQKYLDMVCKFHNNSARNTMLILMQKPDATYVAPIGTWNKQFRRFVRKGEKGLSIFAPFMQKDTGNTRDKSASYTIVPVFDLSQTQGDPFPEKDMDLTLCSKDPAPTIKAMEEISPCRFAYGSADSKAFYDSEKNVITIDENLKPYDKARAIIHALSYALVETNTLSDKFDSAAKDIQSRGLEYVLARSMGFDTDSLSFGKVSSWSEGKESGEILYALSVINKLSDSTLKKLETEIPFARQSVELSKNETRNEETKKNEAKKPETKGMKTFYDELKQAQEYIRNYDENIKLSVLSDVELLNTDIYIDDKKANLRLCANLYTNELSLFVSDQLLNKENFISIGNLSEKILENLSYENLFRYCYDILQPMFERMANTVDFSIYQINTSKNEAVFRTLDELAEKGRGILPQDYTEEYSGRVVMKEGSLTKALDGIYKKFNEKPPYNFRGHSLATSDIVVIKGYGAFFIDDPGYKDITQVLLKGNKEKAKDIPSAIEKRYPLPSADVFEDLPPEKASNFINMYGMDMPEKVKEDKRTLLKAVEDALEQNDNHFDGIINNLPPGTEPSEKPQEQESKDDKTTLSDLEYGDVILYSGKIYAVENKDENGITLRDNSAPAYGGILEGTHEELIFDGWKDYTGFELLFKHEPTAELEEAKAAEAFRKKTYESFNRIGKHTAQEIESSVRDAINKALSERGIDIFLRDVLITGSRSRGREEMNSDLDIVLSYEGSISEKDILKTLQGVPGLDQLEGIKIALTAIRPEESGRLSQYLKNEEEKFSAKKEEKVTENKEPILDKSSVMVEIGFTESAVLSRFIEERGSNEMSYALAEAILYHLDNYADHLGYDKTDFTAYLDEGGYSGRYDIGSEGYTLSEHIEDVLKYYADHGDKEAEKLYNSIRDFLYSKCELNTEERQELTRLMKDTPIVPFWILRSDHYTLAKTVNRYRSEEELMAYPGADKEERERNAKLSEAFRLTYDDYDPELMYAANLAVFEGSTTEEKLNTVVMNRLDIAQMKVKSVADLMAVGSGDDMKAYYYDDFSDRIKERPLSDDIKNHLIQNEKEMFRYMDVLKQEEAVQSAVQTPVTETPAERQVLTQKSLDMLTEDYRSRNTGDALHIDLSGYEVRDVTFSGRDTDNTSFSITLDKAAIDKCTFESAAKVQDLSEADVSGCKFVSVVFENTVFDSAKIEGSTFKDCRFINCDFQGAQFEKVTFDSCYFDKNDFLLSSLEDVTFTPDCRAENNQFNIATVQCSSAEILDTLRGKGREEAADIEPNSLVSLVTEAENTLEKEKSSRKESTPSKNEQAL